MCCSAKNICAPSNERLWWWWLWLARFFTYFQEDIINIANIEWCLCCCCRSSVAESLSFYATISNIAVMASWVIIKIHFLHIVSFLCAIRRRFLLNDRFDGGFNDIICKSYIVLRGIRYSQMIIIFLLSFDLYKTLS